MSDFPPFIVRSYNSEAVESFVREFTDGDARGEIFEKGQIRYLKGYLQEDRLNAKTVVFETDYVDRTYLEDYTEYYATCFRRHPRHCARIHFFSSQFDSRQFLAAISNMDSTERELLTGLKSDRNPYLGFIVIRPIPSTFFAKVCLRPFEPRSQAVRKVITKNYTASLFGIELTVSTIALLEQDKIVAACATSALWALLNASNHLVESRIPSPSAITKAAMHLDGEGARTFPNYGLTQTQILRTLGRQGLDVTSESLAKGDVEPESRTEFFERFKEIAYAHLQNDTPVLLGGFVYELKEEFKEGNEIEAAELGAHLVCVLGFKMHGTTPEHAKYSSQAIEKLYVHDDRYGPYARLNVAKCVTVNIPQKDKPPRSVVGYLLDTVGVHGEILVPDFFAVGHSHKIRIPYKSARSICRLLSSLHQDFGERLNGQPALKALAKSFEEEVVWDIALTTNRRIKGDPASHCPELFFNGAQGSRGLLMAPLPKYVWRCRVLLEDQALLELLVDATEIPQGKTILGWISRSPLAELLRQFLAEHYSPVGEQQLPTSIQVKAESVKEAVSSFNKFFRDPAKGLNFDELFGFIGLPARALKGAEQNEQKNVVPNSDIRTLYFPTKGSPDSLNLERNSRYIWVVDKDGNFKIAKDIEDPPAGHPTLVGGRVARVAGELEWDKEASIWVMNTKSGTYSQDINPDETLQKTYLSNVQEYFFENGTIEIKVLPPRAPKPAQPETQA